MFHAARLKLTFWYLLIIMLISISFSAVVYQLLTIELDRVEHLQQLRQRQIGKVMLFKQNNSNNFTIVKPAEEFLLQHHLIEETKHRLIFRLITINGGILILSGIAGYFLAGRTLRPIQEMVIEQNRFITDASHELRTPLTSLRTEIEVAMRNKALTVTEAKTLLKSNLEEVITLQRLSDNLITLTKQKTNQTAKEKISLLDVVEQALKKVIPLARKKEIQIDNYIEDIMLVGDRQSLSQVFVILLDNAIKYSEAKKKITLRAKQTKKEIIIRVSDQGMGINRKDLPYIFDRFYRADGSRSKKETDGYGLGLSIAKEIIKTHLGTIDVASKVNKGTTFSIRLPLQQTA